MTGPVNVIMVAVVGRGVYWMASAPVKQHPVPERIPRSGRWLTPLARFLIIALKS